MNPEKHFCSRDYYFLYFISIKSTTRASKHGKACISITAIFGLFQEIMIILL